MQAMQAMQAMQPCSHAAMQPCSHAGHAGYAIHVLVGAHAQER